MADEERGSPLVVTCWVIHCRRIVISSAVRTTVEMSTSLSSPRLISWFSRTNWCAPVLSHYSAMGVQSQWISIPMILPIDASTLVNYCSSVQEAYAVIQDYEGKMLQKASRYSNPVIACYLSSLRWSASPVQVTASLPVVITGCVDDVLCGCPLQSSVDGYEECGDCQLSVAMEPRKIVAIYGNYVRFVVVKEPKGSEEIQQCIDHRFSDYSMVVYFESGCDLEQFSGFNTVLIPVKHLGVSFKGGNVESANCIVQIIAYNSSV